MKIARIIGLVLISSALAVPAHGQLLRKKKPTPVTEGDSVAPDKVLFERATDQIKHGHYEVSRLQLNALLNTYPDSAYLAKAKLAIADSYFKEGGTGNLNLAIDEYKSFITFFPFLDEAAYAQMQVAMTHYRRMGKADRDRSEAQLAEQEFQTFLQKYPNSPLFAASQQRLRDVQEDLADGDFKIASYYNGRKSYRAAAGRLADIADRYPLYSKSDQVLWMLAGVWEKAPMQTKEQEQMAAARRALQTTLLTNLVRDYPLSPYVPAAKAKLKDLGAPIPQPDAAALSRMQQEQNMPRPRSGPAGLHRVTEMVHSGPDVSMSARVGMPNMNPPDQNGGETLKAAVGGLNIATVGGSVGGEATTATGTTTSNTISGQTVSADGSTAPVPAASGATAMPTVTPPGQPSIPSSPTGTNATQPTTPAGGAQTTPADATAKPCPPADAKSNTDTKGGSSTTPQAGCSNTGKESSSKKKKGIKKIIPWSGSGPGSGSGL